MIYVLVKLGEYIDGNSRELKICGATESSEIAAVWFEAGANDWQTLTDVYQCSQNAAVSWRETKREIASKTASITSNSEIK